jgi:hypothetical protein
MRNSRTRRRARKAERQRDDDTRVLSNGCAFWDVCQDARCRRAGSCCTQASETCLRSHTDQLSPEQFIWRDHVMAARYNGLDATCARSAARKAIVQYRQMRAQGMERSAR